jgi:hypothetical protein
MKMDVTAWTHLLPCGSQYQGMSDVASSQSGDGFEDARRGYHERARRGHWAERDVVGDRLTEVV